MKKDNGGIGGKSFLIISLKDVYIGLSFIFGIIQNSKNYNKIIKI